MNTKAIDKEIEGVCCFDCGRNYLTEKQKEQPRIVTARTGICCLCGQEKIITSIRHFNYLRLPNTQKQTP